MSLEATVDYVEDILNRLPQGTNRAPWSPIVLRILSFTCPFVVFGRINHRLDDLEQGGDGLGTPSFSIGRELTWQRERARGFGLKDAERFENFRAWCIPCKFLVESEEQIYELCAERKRRRQELEGYEANTPMTMAPWAGGRCDDPDNLCGTILGEFLSEYPCEGAVAAQTGLGFISPTLGPLQDGIVRRQGGVSRFRTRLDDIEEAKSSRASENTLKTLDMARESNKLSSDPAADPDADAGEGSSKAKLPGGGRMGAPTLTLSGASGSSVEKDVQYKPRSNVVGIAWTRPKDRRSRSQSSMSIPAERVEEMRFSSTDERDIVTKPDNPEIDPQPAPTQEKQPSSAASNSQNIQSDGRDADMSTLLAPPPRSSLRHASNPDQGRKAVSTEKSSYQTAQGDGNEDSQSGEWDVRMYGSVSKSRGRSVSGKGKGVQTRSSSGRSFVSVPEGS